MAEYESRESSPMGTAFGKAVGLVAGLVRLVGLIFALILIGYILLTVFEANPASAVTMFFADFATSLTLWFDGLFTPDDPKIGVVVNYGLAAVFWLVAASLLARLLGAARPSRPSRTYRLYRRE